MFPASYPLAINPTHPYSKYAFLTFLKTQEVSEQCEIHTPIDFQCKIEVEKGKRRAYRFIDLRPISVIVNRLMD